MPKKLPPDASRRSAAGGISQAAEHGAGPSSQRAVCRARASNVSPARPPASPPTPRCGSARRLGTSAQLWLNLQNSYDVQIAERKIGKALDKIENVVEGAAGKAAA